MNHLKLFANSAAVLLIAGCGMATAQQAPPAAPPQATPPPAAWRLECAGDGKILECQLQQSLINRDDGKLVVLATVRLPPNAQPTMVLQLPLGLNVAEPVQVGVDNAVTDKQPVQTCTNAGCFVSFPLNDKLMLALRTGTALKVTVQDSAKHSITIDIPLMGFGMALDKATK
jgi:invasion protein IalB